MSLPASSAAVTRRPGTRVLFVSAVLTGVFGLGLFAGTILLPRASPAPSAVSGDDHAEESEHQRLAAASEHQAEEPQPHEGEEEEGEHVALTRQAVANLGLSMGNVLPSGYWKTVLVPARVVEVPGQSDLSVSAPVAGIVDEIDILPGQTIDAEQRLLVLRMTDEALTETQSQLLEAVTQQEIVEQELDRITPLAESGAVSATRKRELEYELKQLTARQGTLVQELRGRGMPESMLRTVLEERKLVTMLDIRPPAFVAAAAGPATGSSGFSIEQLRVHPGMTITRGAELCNLAYHTELYVEGTAFEQDLPMLHRIAEQDWSIEAELESDHQEGRHDSHKELKLLRIDNHVDEETQTIRFYCRLDNQVTRVQRDGDRVFEQWRFRPGQRMHLRLPVEHWADQLVLPAAAVVIEGPNASVFVEHDEQEEPGDASPGTSPAEERDEGHEEVMIELEPVPVTVLHRDDRSVVIADEGQLCPDDSVALNNAYKLHLALQVQAGGGGGHHHHHDH